MKTLTTLKALVAGLLFSSAVNAQSGITMIKLAVTNNSNMPSQAPAYLVFQFAPGGNDSLAFPDAGNQGTLGQFNDEVFPFSVTPDNQVITNFDVRSELTSYRTIPFGIVTKNAGDVKIIATVHAADSLTPTPDFVWLEQLSTGERYSILDTVKFTLTANQSFASDFILHTGTRAISGSTDETCSGMNDGQIGVSGPNYAGFTHELTDLSTSVTTTNFVYGTDTTITNLAPGAYVSVIRINGIPVDSMDVTVNPAALLIADFSSDYNYVAPGSVVNFTDNSTGAVSYIWCFGTGDSSTVAGSESYTYVNAGSYVVTLTVTDANGCTSSAFDNIEVSSTPPPAQQNTFNGHPSSFSGPANNNNNTPVNNDPIQDSREDIVYYSNARIFVTSASETATVNIVSMTGQVIYTGLQTTSTGEYAVPAAGTYVVTVVHTNGTAQTKTILAQ